VWFGNKNKTIGILSIQISHQHEAEVNSLSYKVLLVTLNNPFPSQGLNFLYFPARFCLNERLPNKYLVINCLAHHILVIIASLTAVTSISAIALLAIAFVSLAPFRNEVGLITNRSEHASIRGDQDHRQVWILVLFAIRIPRTPGFESCGQDHRQAWNLVLFTLWARTTNPSSKAQPQIYTIYPLDLCFTRPTSNQWANSRDRDLE